MNNKLIHLINSKDNNIKFIVVLLPGIIFILVLIIFLSISSHRPKIAATTTSNLNVLGTNK
mgnify:CR=1 FL=1